MSGSTWRERQRRRRPAFEVAPHEAVGGHAELERRLAPRRRRRPAPCFFASASTPRMRRTPGSPSCWWMCVAHGADVRAGRRRARRAAPASSAACARAGRRRAIRCQPRACAQVLAQQLPGLRVEQADVQVVPLHLARAGRSSRAARRSTRASTSTQPSRCTVRSPKR